MTNRNIERKNKNLKTKNLCLNTLGIITSYYVIICSGWPLSRQYFFFNLRENKSLCGYGTDIYGFQI